MTKEAIRDENRRIRQLRISSDLLLGEIRAGKLTVEKAERMIEGVRLLAAKLFPGKDRVFELVYMPRFRRALREAGYMRDYEFRVIPGGRMDEP
jgi:hypothetical protein